MVEGGREAGVCTRRREKGKEIKATTTTTTTTKVFRLVFPLNTRESTKPVPAATPREASLPVIFLLASDLPPSPDPHFGSLGDDE